jgi:hypothetical protein
MYDDLTDSPDDFPCNLPSSTADVQDKPLLQRHRQQQIVDKGEMPSFQRDLIRLVSLNGWPGRRIAGRIPVTTMLTARVLRKKGQNSM